MPRTRLANSRLYGFIDAAYLDGRPARELTRYLIAGGVDLIQVRAKEYTHAKRVALALEVIGEAYVSRVPVIINDDIAAAVETGADGVHLGQEDWAATHREQLAGVRIVGLSTHSLEQARQAERAGVDYIGVGPVFSTNTKPGVPAVGLQLITAVAGAVKLPFFAIGGITLHNLGPVKAAGATRVAVVSAILRAPDVQRAAAQFKEQLTS